MRSLTFTVLTVSLMTFPPANFRAGELKDLSETKKTGADSWLFVSNLSAAAEDKWVKGPQTGQAKKNRRGQRARQKYGLVILMMRDNYS